MTQPTDRPAAEEPHRPAPGAEWQRLAPRSLIVQPVGFLKAGGVPALIAIGGVASQMGWFALLALPGLIAVAALAGLASYYSTSFIVVDGQLRVRRGLINRTTKTANLDKVRNVDLEAPLLHRVFGLTRVEIGTGVDETRIELDSLGVTQARELQQLLLRPTAGGVAATAEPDVGDTDGVELARLDPRWASFAPLKLGGLAVLAGAFGVLTQSIDRERFSDLDWADAAWQWLVGQALALVVVAVTLLAVATWVVLSLAAYLVRWWQLRLVRTDDTLRLTAGLVTTRSTSIELSRIRGLRVTRPLLVRRAGGSDLATYATGVEEGTTTILPTAPLAEVRRVGASLLADHAPLVCNLTEHGPAARARIRFRALATLGLLSTTVVAATAVAALQPTESRPALAIMLVFGVTLLATAALVAWLAARATYAHLGHARTEHHLVAGNGTFTDVREVLQTDGIIGWVIRQSWFQRRRGLAHLVATTAAGPEQVVVRDLPRERAIALADAVTPGMLDDFLVVNDAARP